MKKNKEISNYLFNLVGQGCIPIPNCMEEAKETFISTKEFREEDIAVSFKTWENMLYFLNMIKKNGYGDIPISQWSSGFKIVPIETIQEYKNEGLKPIDIKFIYSQGGLKSSLGISRRECDSATYQIWFKTEYSKKDFVTKKQLIVTLLKYLKTHEEWYHHKIVLVWNPHTNQLYVEEDKPFSYYNESDYIFRTIYEPNEDYYKNKKGILETKDYEVFKNKLFVDGFLKPFNYR